CNRRGTAVCSCRHGTPVTNGRLVLGDNLGSDSLSEGKRNPSPFSIALTRQEPHFMKPILCLLLASLMTTTTNAAAQPIPPDAEKRPHVVKAPFGASRNDDYYWM